MDLFEHLNINKSLTNAISALGFVKPTPIQSASFSVIRSGNDMVGIAQTGTGKTAAFALPILQYLFKTQCTPTPRSTRALVLAPTRELAIQIADNCKIYGKYLSLRQTTIYGGVNQKPLRLIKIQKK